MARKPKPPVPDQIKGLRQRQNADGSWRLWWEPSAVERKLGFKPVRLSADAPTHAAREARALNAKVEQARDPTAKARSYGRTIADLIEVYKSSRYWADRAPKTQQSYDRLHAQILRKWGDENVIEFTKPVMATWYETIAATGKVTLARQLIRQMSILFSHAEIIGWRPENSNPCFRLRMVSPKPRSARVSWADLDALVTTADMAGLPSIGTAALLLVLQGQRSTDVRKARLSDFELVALTDDAPPVWVWVLDQSKRGKRVAMQLHPEVEARIKPMLLRAAENASAPVCPRPDTGTAYSEDLMIKHFNRVCADTGRKSLLGIQMRDLRRTFGILARAGGASREDTADALGNTAGKDPRLYDTYMPATVLTASRAVRAIERPVKGKKG